MLDYSGSIQSMAIPSVCVAVVYHSGRGHAARQAEVVARRAASMPGTHVDLLNVAALTAEHLGRRMAMATQQWVHGRCYEDRETCVRAGELSI